MTSKPARGGVSACTFIQARQPAARKESLTSNVPRRYRRLACPGSSHWTASTPREVQMTELPDCWGALKSHRREGRAETPGRLSMRRPATGPPRIPSQNAGHNCGRYWMAAKQWDSSSRPVNSPSTNGTTPQAANQMRSHSRGLAIELDPVDGEQPMGTERYPVRANRQSHRRMKAVDRRACR